MQTPLAGHTTLKPTKFPQICLDFFSEDLMFLPLFLVGALFLRLVPLTKLDESFGELPIDCAVFHKFA